MERPKRATIYFNPAIHKALRPKAASIDRSIADLVNDAMCVALAEDAEDLEAREDRKSEASASFETMVRDLRKPGRI